MLVDLIMDDIEYTLSVTDLRGVVVMGAGPMPNFAICVKVTSRIFHYIDGHCPHILPPPPPCSGISGSSTFKTNLINIFNVHIS